jgi:hypothetical protein
MQRRAANFEIRETRFRLSPAFATEATFALLSPIFAPSNLHDLIP